MSTQKLFPLFLLLLLTACKKDKVAISGLQNSLISGGGQTSFQRIVSGQKIDALYSVKQTNDGYIFCGFTENETTSKRDVLLLKTNLLGETLWTKIFTGANSDQGWFVEKTSDNGFVLTLSNGLLKTDDQGNELWRQSYSVANHTTFFTARQTDDGGFIICGSELENERIILLKTDPSGNEIWRKVFGNSVSANCMTISSDGGFIIGGTKHAGNSDDAYIVKTDSSGETLWIKASGDTRDNMILAIAETETGNIVTCGSNANPGLTGFMQVLDVSTNELTNKDFTDISAGYLNGVEIIGANKFVFTTSNGALLIADASGNLIWYKIILPQGMFNEIKLTNDLGFVIAGYLPQIKDGYIVKTDANGN